MKDEWRADIVKRLFQYDIPREELAKETGMTTSYLNMILAGTRNPKNAESELTSAVSRLVARNVRKEEGGDSS